MRGIRFAPPTLAARHLQNRDRARLRARLGSAMRHRSRRRHADMPTCRHADMPTCRTAATAATAALPPLPPQPGETARPHSASDAAAYALGHRRSIGAPSAFHRRSVDERADNERSTPNARDRDAPRGAPRMRARSNPRIARAVIPACCSMPSIPGSRRAARGRALRSRPTPRRSPRATNRCTAPTTGPPAAPRRHRNCIAY
ncbi:hypothetical protein FE789_31985 [Burkholderia pseudomallei]|nr:hypothetical protein FE789_31985 [Burkholderia pseudomallei]